MAKLNIDGKEYDSSELSEESLGQIQSIKFVDEELTKLRSQAAALQTARNAYANALKITLSGSESNTDRTEEVPGDGSGLPENIEFS